MTAEIYLQPFSRCPDGPDSVAPRADAAASRGIYFFPCEGLRLFTPPFFTFPIVSHVYPNIPLGAFRARCCVVLNPIVFRYVSLIFPFLKRKTSGKRSNNERINDDVTWSQNRERVFHKFWGTLLSFRGELCYRHIVMYSGRYVMPSFSA